MAPLFQPFRQAVLFAQKSAEVVQAVCRNILRPGAAHLADDLLQGFAGRLREFNGTDIDSYRVAGFVALTLDLGGPLNRRFDGRG